MWIINYEQNVDKVLSTSIKNNQNKMNKNS